MNKLTLLIGAVLGLALASSAAGEPDASPAARLTLQGRVLAEKGRPLAGARVIVYTAQPRVGIGAACPSCYPECAKSAVTDGKGRFTISGLGDHLLYRLLFVAEGRVPEFRNKVDPLLGPIEETLHARDTTTVPGTHTLVGHVVDPHGAPVAGASVSPVGMSVGDGTMFGALQHFDARIDPVVVTDGNGEFRLTGPDSVRAWVLRVHARGLSPKAFPEVVAHGEDALLRLDMGTTVTGVIMRQGSPVPGAPVGITQVDRDAASYVPLDTVATDERGRFTFVNVPASQDYVFSSVVGALGPWVLRTVVRTVGENDSTTELPPLSLERGFRLKGQVIASDGRAIPPGTELALTRELASGQIVVPMDAEGRFAIEGLPPETIALGIRLRGYHIGPATPGYIGRRTGVRIPMLRDHDDLKIVLDPDPPAAAAAGGSPRP